MPYSFKIFFIIVFLNPILYAIITYAYISLGKRQTWHSICLSLAGVYDLGALDQGIECLSLHNKFYIIVDYIVK
jgi:hypothetical protein